MRRHSFTLVTGVMLIAGLTLLVVSCSKSPASLTGPANLANAPSRAVITGGNGALDPSLNGRASEMPAYYDSTLFNINFMELPSNAATALLAHNKSINHIYEMDPDQPAEQPFVPVLDAIQGDGFNPLWVEVEIQFNEGFTPHQFYSDNQVLAAAAGANPEITLTTTTEVYRCSVLGPKK